MNSNKINRRDFLRNSSMLLAMSALHPYRLYADAKRVALIGTGWYGKSDLFRLMQVAPVEVVGLCDVDAHELEQAVTMVNERQQQKNLATFSDYRKLLKETKPDIVLIGTPDHWHAFNDRCNKIRCQCIPAKANQQRCNGRRSYAGCCKKIQKRSTSWHTAQKHTPFSGSKEKNCRCWFTG